MRIRKDFPRPLYRQEFSDRMFKQHKWTLNVQDSTLTRLTSALYEDLTNGELCADSYDPYVALERALTVYGSIDQAREILEDIEDLLSKAIKDVEPESNYWKNLNNWRAAWNIYSQYLESAVFPKV